MSKWTHKDIPDQSNRVIIITGANSGLGFESAKALCRKNGTVIMASRSSERANQAIDKIHKELPDATLDFIQLDLGNRDSIDQFVSSFNDKYDQLDILLNNAGLMAIPERRTDTGFEMQIGVNHFGHFILTGLLIDLINSTPGSRVTTVSSYYHTRIDKIHMDNINLEGEYEKWKAYSQSKLANMLFALELNRKLDTAGLDTISNAAHPGYAATNLQSKGPEMEGSRFLKLMMKIGNFLFAQSAENGALPQLYAATSEEAEGGNYYGPQGFMNMRGAPGVSQWSKTANNEDLAKTFWEFSEEMTGVEYNI